MTQSLTPYKLEFIDEESTKLINTIKNHYDEKTKSAILLELDCEKELIQVITEKIINVIKKIIIEILILLMIK